MSSTRYLTLEPLESRIAPANVFPNPIYPLPDVVAGPGQTGTSVDLSHIFDSFSESPYRTILKISTNFDADPNTPGIQGDIFIELYDDVAPLTVQNFLAYAFNKNADGDYMGTFFHRLEQNFVLQGGGYQTNGKKLTHIDTLPSVHNEFDPLRSNVRGTIAMAKVGGDPNSATSEWFFNLADNSSNLDNQNGGFTVFARVLDMPDMVDGMEVIDAIAKLPTYAVFSGAKAPVQGFDPALGGAPAKENLIRIDKVEVVPRDAGNDQGLSYQVESVKRVVGGDVTAVDSDILSYSFTGSTLNLKYLDGKAGVAEVKIKISKAGQEPYYETFRVNLQPNLTTQITKDAFQAALIPGDSAKVKLQIANTGGGLASGAVELKFYLIPLQEGVERVELNSVITSINVKSGGFANLAANVHIPTDLSAIGEAYYQLGVEVVPLDGFSSEERFADDNVGKGNNHQAHNRFGSFATSELIRTNAVLTYVEPDGDVVKLSIKGVGSGKLVPGSDGILDLELSGTNAASKVIAKIISAEGDGNLSLRNIDAVSVVGSLQFGKVDVTGNLAFTAGVKKVVLDEVTGPSFMSIGLFTGKESQKASLTFGSVSDLSLQSLMSIKSLTAREWLNTDGQAETILVPGLSTLKITGDRSGTRGDFDANLDVTGSGAVNTFKVAGLLNDSVVRISGNVKSAAIGGMVNSSFLVGANDRPSELSDFTDVRTVNRFAITGVSGVSETFVNSTVAADTFRKISIRGVDADSGTDAFGVVANTIATYSRDGGPKLKNLKTPGTSDQLENYRVVVL